jgi:eukaryotic-like serine/threonine-protein kinase
MIPDAVRTALQDTYRVERELGAGGMATVYLARDLRHDRLVALKVLRPDLAAVLGADRFLAEIRTTATLQHPHILGLIDSGQADGMVFYVMPYVAGESLRDRLTREKQLPVDDAVRITTEIAHALDYAHRQGIIHRDIKPENILLQDGQAMVADFGIALAATQAVGGRMTETGMSLGTPQYMSPEQALGERDLTPRSDQYALACVLYELLAGEPPFTGPTVQAIVARVMTAEPETVTALRGATPPAVAAALTRALQKVPADRFKSCGAFAEALGTPGAPTAAPHPQGLAARWLPWVAALAIALAWGISALGTNPPASATATDYVEFAIEPPAGERIDGIREFAISPDGRRVAFATRDSVEGTRLYVRSLDSREVYRVPGSEDATSPFFAPDGQRIAFGAGGQLLAVDPVNGRRTIIAQVDPDGQTVRVGNGSWGADDTLFVSQATDSGYQLMKVAATGGPPRWVFPDKARRRFVGGHLPGGLLAFSEVGSDSSTEYLAVLTRRTGEVRKLGDTGTEPRYSALGELIYGKSDGSVVARPFDLRRTAFTGPPRTLAVGLRLFENIPHAWSSGTGALLLQEAEDSRTALVEVSPGGAEREVTRGVGLTGPRYSPDGRRVVFTKGGPTSGAIWVLSIADSSQLALTTPQYQARFPTWSVDGRSILFSGNFDGDEDIGITSIDGTSPPRRLVARSLAQRQPVATPDGSRVLFVDVQNDVGLLDVAADGSGSPRESVTGPGTTERHPAFSPDGRWLAYTSFGTSAEEVLVSPYPGPGPRTAISVGGGVEPVFHPDGRRLFYRSGARLVEATLAFTPELRVISRRVLFERPEYQPLNPGRNYDISPDGSRFLFVKGATNTNQLVVKVPVTVNAPR